jgi:hypothetical protein
MALVRRHPSHPAAVGESPLRFPVRLSGNSAERLFAPGSCGAQFERCRGAGNASLAGIRNAFRGTGLCARCGHFNGDGQVLWCAFSPGNRRWAPLESRSRSLAMIVIHGPRRRQLRSQRIIQPVRNAAPKQYPTGGPLIDD